MTKKQFYTDGQYVMQDGEVYVICNGKHNADVVATALNELLEENKQLKQSFDKSLLSHAKTCDDYRALSKKNKRLKEENEQLKKEKEYWKGNACNYSNYLSILSMDCQIVQEAILDLKKVIDVDTEASKLLDELDDKFDELNEHRIRVRYG